MATVERPHLAVHNIAAAVSELGLGLGREPPSIETEHRGGQCHVFQLTFKDKERDSLAVRVPLYMPGDDAKIHALEAEVKTLQILEAKQFPWAPRCRGYSLTFANPIQHPFVVLTWIAGSPLQWDDHVPPPPLRERLLAQLASFQLSLVECTLASSVPAAAFFERIMANRRKRVQDGKLPGLSDQDCLDQQRLLSTVLGDEGMSETALAMDHGDLQPDNIIVDADGNMQSVIDWAFAGMVPIARAAGLPRFLWPSESLGFASSPATQRDRQVYTASYASQPSQAAAYMRRWQGGNDMDLRTLYLESIFSKGMHSSLAQLGWQPISGQNERQPSFK
ncbi:hypothetical protein SPBR_08527 [Sporothrix brasiliensis 5110]|uniref:Aminoglycoside phosphotransferase domain-containing protein n=1 Tax=Sporothrix brasiliensis 5110 TaxID=1398154 RepID=A0A0C2IN77_9PEZI|nr:uncharacterized protein SPBR_08527 [Sporothrix brasiliensis 5110]KIH86482.1 hypothetical protein SPBR_08527 [Sporothrix brasiliensis 5110]